MICKILPKDVGWSIDEGNHTNSKLLYYKFKSGDTGLTSTLKSKVKAGAAKWVSYGTVSEMQLV